MRSKDWARRYIYKGKEYTTKELSEINGVSENAIRGRIKRGWNIEDAVNIKIAKTGVKARKYIYKDKEYTISELAELSNLSYSTIQHRLSRGINIQDAIETTSKHSHKKTIHISEEEKEYWNNLILDDEYKEKFMNRPIIGSILR